jgi:hypothetical protein
MKIIILSLDSGTDAQCAALWNEVESVLGLSNDPLDELIAEEEGAFDEDTAIAYINALTRQAHGRGCSFPNCHKVPKRCCNGCKHRDGSAR